ncbi:histidine kinase [Cedecea neteri]|uniref:Histidine kinase n=1 Tax=Cedecea neteri TaxID=158822 RepID=A0A2X2T7Y3_9ENTR|nr:histidine kinase [Cedecea neteri]
MPDISIVISDLMLPGELSGADVLQQARRHHPQLDLLLVSGQDLRRSEQHQPEVELLRKPFTRAQLAEALRKARAGSRRGPA